MELSRHKFDMEYRHVLDKNLYPIIRELDGLTEKMSDIETLSYAIKDNLDLDYYEPLDDIYRQSYNIEMFVKTQLSVFFNNRIKITQDAIEQVTNLVLSVKIEIASYWFTVYEDNKDIQGKDTVLQNLKEDYYNIRKLLL